MLMQHLKKITHLQPSLAYKIILKILTDVRLSTVQHIR